MARRMVVALLALMLVFGGTVKSGAQGKDESATKARLEQIANSYTPENAFMGTVLVVEGDTVLLDKGYGMASLEWQVPNVPEAKFRLGSLTKQFTATLVLLLQQDAEAQYQRSRERRSIGLAAGLGEDHAGESAGAHFGYSELHRVQGISHMEHESAHAGRRDCAVSRQAAGL